MTHLVRRVAMAALAAALLLGAGACSRFVILHDPLSAAEHNDLGVAYESAGKPDLARREYRKALRLDSDLTIARVNLGNLDAASERWSSAEKNYRRALRDTPADPHALNNLAWVLFRQGRSLDEAEAFARRALEITGTADTAFTNTLDAIVRARAAAR
jgi:Flp pilus assembly protein TadD